MNTCLSYDALDAVVGGLDMNPATNPGHFAGVKKLPPAPASSPGNNAAEADALIATLGVLSFVVGMGLSG